MFLGQAIPSFYNRLNGRANESTVDILYQLGTNQDAGLMVRLAHTLSHLCDRNLHHVESLCRCLYVYTIQCLFIVKVVTDSTL